MSAQTLKVLVLCGMSDKKLHQKLSPLQLSERIERIHLVRKEPFAGEKVVSHHPPAWMTRWIVLAEAWRFFKVVQLCMTERPDFLVSMTLLFHGFHAFVAHEIFGIPWICHTMGKQDFHRRVPFAKAFAALFWRLTLQADALLVRGEPTRQLYIRNGGVLPERVQIQQNVFDPEDYPPDPGAPRIHDLIYVGFLDDYKNPFQLLDVLERLHARHSTASLVLAGLGPLEDALRRDAAARGLTGHVRFAGHTSHPELVRLLQTSRIFVMTSLGEGLPQALIEAMSCGLPSVLYDDADMREIVDPERNGFLVPSGDVAAFAEAVDRLLGDDALREAVGREARKTIMDRKEDFTASKQSKVWEEILGSVVPPVSTRS